MKDKSLEKMKKVILGVVAMAIVGLTIVNVNLTLNGERYVVNLSLASQEALASNEDQIILKGHCHTDSKGYYTGNGGDEFMVDYWCTNGSDRSCMEGWYISYGGPFGTITYSSVEHLLCVK